MILGSQSNVLGAEFQPQMVAVQADGRTQCIVCGSWYSSLSVARTHVQRMRQIRIHVRHPQSEYQVYRSSTLKVWV